MWEPEKFPSSSSARLIEPYPPKMTVGASPFWKQKEELDPSVEKKGGAADRRINLGIHLLNRNRNLADEFHVTQIYFPSYLPKIISRNNEQ